MNRLNSFRLAAAAAALATSFASPLAFAADTQNLAVSASVAAVCKLTAVPAMSFTLDPSTSAAGSATSAVQYKCTKGTAPTSFTVGGGTSPASFTLAGTGTNLDTIAGSITWTNPTSAGNGFGGAAISVTLTGAIPNANYINVAADTYSQTLAVVINP